MDDDCFLIFSCNRIFVLHEAYLQEAKTLIMFLRKVSWRGPLLTVRFMHSNTGSDFVLTRVSANYQVMFEGVCLSQVR